MAAVTRLLRRANFLHVRANSNKPKSVSPLKNLLESAASYQDAHVKSEWATQPYTHLPPEEDLTAAVDPSENTIVLFPGQGTQYLNMGKQLLKYPGVDELYECANEIVGFDLLKIKTNEELNKHSQVSIVVASLAAMERVRDERPTTLSTCVATAGFSLGEVTALIFSGAITFEQGIKIVNIRSLAMEAASKDHPGGMVTVMFHADAKVGQACVAAKNYCIENNVPDAVCGVANYLYPECKVISGSELALKYLEENAKKYGIRRITRLNVAGAFHSPAMLPAVAPLRAALNLCTIEKPRIPVFSAVNCKRYFSKNDIIQTLPKQLIKPVHWEQLMHKMYARPRGSKFPTTLEVGPGNTLRTILRQVNAQAWDTTKSIFEK